MTTPPKDIIRMRAVLQGIGDEQSLLFAAYAAHHVPLQIAAAILAGFTLWIGFGALFPPAYEDAVHFLDVGQGDAALITLAAPEAGNDPIRILVDAGRNAEVLAALDEVLTEQGPGYLDLVILSHPDADHFGGLIHVLDHYNVGAFLSNGDDTESDGWSELMETLDARQIPHITLAAGSAVRYGDAIIDVLAPVLAPRAPTSTNEGSIVMRLSAPHASGTTTVLFTGDIGRQTEVALVEGGADLAADILKVAHHGSKNSSDTRFIAAVHPRISIISVGDNSYGHPSPEVIDTLTQAGSKTLTTSESGTIRIPLDPATPLVLKHVEQGFFASVLMGSWRAPPITTITLNETAASNGHRLIPYTECSFDDGGVHQTDSSVRFSEIAWMGASTGATHEWIEIKNSEKEAIDLSGWQVINANERLRVTFPQGLLIEDFVLLARKAADTALSLQAEEHFTGSLRNRSEGLRLFDTECNLIDEVLASPTWPAGDNASKRTMELGGDETWHTSLLPGGTPGSLNSSGTSVEVVEPSDATAAEEESYVFAEFEQHDDDTFTAALIVEHVPNTPHDLKVALYTEGGAELSETFNEKEDQWQSSLYYLASLFEGGVYDGAVRLRRKASFSTFSGPATLSVRVREHGKNSFIEHSEQVNLNTPITPATHTPAETKPKKLKPKEVETETGTTLTTEYPATITAGEIFTVTVSANTLEDTSYDLKVSVESGTILSRTFRNGGWSSSQFYIPAAFTGPSVEDFAVQLLVPTSTNPLPSSAELIVRTRTGDASGIVAFRGPLSLIVPHETPTPPSTEENEEEPPPAPEGGEEPEEEVGEPPEEEPEPNVCININTALAESLDEITQIGPALAARIITERESERGPFSSLDDLIRVTGIGPVTVEKIKTEGKACTE